MSAGGAHGNAPAWVGNVVLPLLNLAAALIVSGVLILLLGADPVRATRILVANSWS